MSRPGTAARWGMAGLLVAAVLAVPTGALAEGNPPVVSNGSVSPTSLPYTGGDVMVSADVASEDFTPLSDVTVVIRSGFDTAGEMALTPDGGGSTYRGTVELGANPSHTPITWTFAVRARDIDNQEVTADIGQTVVGGQPPDDAVPSVSDPSVAPRTVSADGGDIAFAVTASDVRSVASVYADVARGSTIQRVPLSPVPGAPDRFAGTYRALSNPTTSSRSYSVHLTAMNERGFTTTVDAGRVTVRARPSGTLMVDRRRIHFAVTRVGGHRTAHLVIVDRGAVSTVPVLATVSAVGSSFRVGNATARVMHVRLRGGESVTIPVLFTPTSAGAKHGSVVVSRSDGLQKPRAVVLSGTAVRGRAAKLTGG